MSPSLLIVPVAPIPPVSAIERLSACLGDAFGRTVRVADPIAPPAAARLGTTEYAAEPLRAALAAWWGCGCRDRIVGVTAATEAETGADPGPWCGGVVVLCLQPDTEMGRLVRAVGRSFGLGDCHDPGCAMHPRGGAAGLCHACRARC